MSGAGDCEVTHASQLRTSISVVYDFRSPLGRVTHLKAAVMVGKPVRRTFLAVDMLKTHKKRDEKQKMTKKWFAGLHLHLDVVCRADHSSHDGRHLPNYNSRRRLCCALGMCVFQTRCSR